MSFMKSNRLMTAAFLLTVSTTAGAFAQQTPDSVGIVRITDGRPRSVGSHAAGQRVKQVSACENGSANMPCNNGSGSSSSSCNNGMCPTGSCPNGSACQAGQCPTCRGCLHGRFGEHYCKHSPDYGYSPPAKYPLHRRGVEYTNDYPAQWYGAGADYSQSRSPMVYQPTDTTQLGFYYQHVPSWQPSPNRLPDRPIPAQWNITAPAVSASRYCGGCYPGNLGSYHGLQRRGHGHGFGRRSYDVTGWCPADGSGVQQGATGSGEVVPPMTMPPGSEGLAPTPVESNPPGVMAPGTVPQQNPSYDEGSEPSALPVNPNSAAAPNKGAVPGKPTLRTDSASSGHIRRIGFRY